MPRITKTVPERRQEIIDIAKDIFIAKGFDNTQITDIAKKMNVSQGLVYHYFKSKVEILYAVIDEIAAKKQERIDATLRTMESTAAEKLFILLNEKLDSDSLENLVPSITSDIAIIEYCSRKISASAMPMILSLLKQGNLDGSWNCEFPEEYALFLSSGFSGFYKNIGNAEDNTRKKNALQEIILRVLGQSPDRKN